MVDIKSSRAYRRDTPVRVLSYVGTADDWSQTACIIRQDGPTPEWYVVKFDSDGAKLCVHASRLSAQS